MSSSTLCLRCLKRSLVPLESSLPPTAVQRAAFSTSPSLAVNPPKKKAVGAKPTARSGKSLKLAKNTRTATARPPAPGERKALRKRVVLSNTNALEVHGLQDLSKDSVSKLREYEGRVLGLSNDSVDALRALEAFKPNQGWSLFRRPATLVRKETVELAEMMSNVKETQKVDRRVLAGEKGSGKSVLQLQAMTMAYLQGWIVMHFPEAKEMTIAHEAYQPVKLEDGTTGYIQPQYTAHLLSNFAKANHGLLNNLRLSKEPKLPVPVQSNITLLRFVELGATDAELAWPVWQALWAELLAPSQPSKEGLHRPPIFVSLDGLEFIMRDSAYLSAEAQPVHAHDLLLARDFVNLLSGSTNLPNGGTVLAASSAGNRPSVPTLDFFLNRNHLEACNKTYKAIVDRLAQQIPKLKNPSELDLTELENPPNSLPPFFLSRLDDLETRLRNTKDVAQLSRMLSHRNPAVLQEWNPYLPIDSRVAETMKPSAGNKGNVVGTPVQKLAGLSKAEARGMMEYYAQSGMLRQTVTEGLVSERWSLSGEGVVGELEKGSVRARF
ncbi:hypothetical protein KC331_g1597 [Hortaea werneckii]|uniref:Small ribosomal subunit protein mS29 n=1 Tax=Hortaea werneckii TaxID=91943 RepID=A0A3M7D3Z7_HORWE|nr:hypothetical protein KC331_g1597 [Hortaea werneckii]KAI7720932.1 hypothetical protein KC353_g1777 [Hortaea werneckii]RMY59075.1 hypothetical protein D0865_02266 [Hortaea werneckii]